jgi:PAS domain-containing protein
VEKKAGAMNARQAQDAEHEEILREMLEQFQPVFDHSPMGVYLCLDDVHKLCNERMAKMFGVTVKEWNAMPSFLHDPDLLARQSGRVPLCARSRNNAEAETPPESERGFVFLR